MTDEALRLEMRARTYAVMYASETQPNIRGKREAQMEQAMEEADRIAKAAK